MSELPDLVPPASLPEPRPSALGIVLRRDGPGWTILFGRRAAGSKFMPGHLAFPGGRLERADGDPSDDGAWAQCVAREVLEETGIDIPPEGWAPAGERTTPPFFPVRFRTKFFVAELPDGVALSDSPPQPEEIEALVFAKPEEMLDAWTRGEALVPPPVLPVLRDAAARPPASALELAGRVALLNAAEEALPRIEFAPDVWVWPAPTRTLPPATHTNVWMPGAAKFVFVDPGSEDEGAIEVLVKLAARRTRETGAHPAAILLTHHHGDHASGARALATATGLPILAHRATLERVPLEGVEARPLDDGGEVDLDGARLVAAWTPGHAPGHLAFHEPERGWLFSGDLTSALSTILVGMDDGDMGAYLDSLRRAAALGAKRLFPGHGGPVPPKALERTLDHRLEREDRVARALGAEPRSLSEIAREAYADTPEAPAFLAELQARAHLRHLEEKGRAARSEAGWARKG